VHHYPTPGTPLPQQKQAAERANMPLILGPDHPLAKQAFQHQQPSTQPPARRGTSRAYAASPAVTDGSSTERCHYRQRFRPASLPGRMKPSSWGQTCLAVLGGQADKTCNRSYGDRRS
jgi:hypothetical protein